MLPAGVQPSEPLLNQSFELDVEVRGAPEGWSDGAQWMLATEDQPGSLRCPLELRFRGRPKERSKAPGPEIPQKLRKFPSIAHTQTP